MADDLASPLLRLLALSVDMLSILGPDGRFLYANRAFESLGYAPEELTGRPFLDLVWPDDRQAVADRIREAGDDEIALDCRLLCKDGSERWTSWRMSRQDDGTRHALARDATERRWVERELRASLSLVEATLESTADGIVVVDDQARVVIFNRKYVEMWEIPVDLLDARDADPINAFVATRVADAGAFAAMLEDARLRPHSESYRQLDLRDGRVFEGYSRPRRIGEAVHGRVWSFRDVTERVRAERVVREHLIMGLEHAVEGICRFDAQGRFLSVNGIFAAMTGYEAEELLGREWIEIIVEADRDRVTRAYQRMLRSGKVEVEARCARKDGSTLHVRALMVSAATDGSNSGHHYFVKDITEQKQIEERLVVNERMASMGTLAAGVAHEINNPLAYVMANLEVLIEGLPELVAALGDERVRAVAQILDDVRDGTERMRCIVRDLKLFSRPDETPNGPVDVTKVLEVAIKMASNEIKHRARLVKRYSDVPMVEGNDRQLGQVFLNLLMNAAQAIPEGAVGLNEIRVVTQLDASGRVAVEVTDSGMGMAPGVLPRIFDPFFTTKAVGVGTGLGLSVCHGIVTKLGGEITVRSEVGKGATFRVLLPAARATAATGPRPEGARAQRRGRVLVVDDEILLGTAIRRVLEREHDAVVCASGDEALLAIANDGPWDVILCDLMMSEMSGMELHDAIGRVAPDYVGRMMFMTGGAFTDRAQEFLSRVPNARIDKPIDFATLRRTIRAMMASRPRSDAASPD